MLHGLLTKEVVSVVTGIPRSSFPLTNFLSSQLEGQRIKILAFNRLLH